MPTITIFKDDLESLLTGEDGVDRGIPMAQLEEWLMLVKGELKGHNQETGELRIELQDSNRPDLWCCEGIARQIRIKQRGRLTPYAFFAETPKPPHHLIVKPGMEQVRPYVAACTAKGYRVTQKGLAQLIQTQEKLADIFGRKRKTVSIGIYQLRNIAFPVTYELVKPDEVRFTPLGMETTMTLSEILMVHPKGLEYGPILAAHSRLPILRDAKAQPLSFPPIVNSREIGEVRVGDDELFVEVTGTDLPMVVLSLNIFAANLADRGATIEPVEVRYPTSTKLGTRVTTPQDFGKPTTIRMKAIEQALGQELGEALVTQALEAYGYDVSAENGSVQAKLPPYRHDLMHTMDVVEDVAMSRGYAEFTPVMPAQFTVGGLSAIEQLSDRSRELMVGLGFQEIISNILGSPDQYCRSMRLEGTEWGKTVEVDNVMSLSFSCLRQWMLPSLLRIEAASSRAFYPHRLFEAGDVAIPDGTHELGSRTETVVGALIAHATTHFSEIHSCLDVLCYYLGKDYSLEPLRHPSFLEGRAGRILVSGKPVGVIGEVHPEVLERWQISMPVVAFDVNLSKLTAG
ncbi:phenylalanine--tRNA ligase subunit beta [Candidatus Nitrospira nitrificans]|uniref:phenylalanine--tRNA ligase n=1 Tax=Candidatus Nitrospira nitrificans TaxID=1742973 RepID=A0A0S4LFT7_9BACT|nr:phenylalanine--tRNA ligase subunit beta [Candidatus Nitrospira nitrificans]CUS35578.1 Phenylalanyl-tRNA synthetase, beta subunit [Candidatus Nitrospira nitrificans]